MIKLVQLNIEQGKHIPLVTDFLKSVMPEVACIQEVQEADVKTLEGAMGATAVFMPMMYRGPELEGVAIFTTLPIVASGSEYYAGDGVMRVYDATTAESKIMSQSYGVLWVDVQKDDVVYRFMTTHFTWTPDGKSSDHQRTHMASMFEVTKQLEGFVFCGDFNTPRGDEMFAEITKHYIDNVPLEYKSSIDANIHRKGNLGHMVDGIFTTPDYQVSDVVMRCGVSDHCAFVANVSKPS